MGEVAERGRLLRDIWGRPSRLYGGGWGRLYWGGSGLGGRLQHSGRGGGIYHRQPSPPNLCGEEHPSLAAVRASQCSGEAAGQHGWRFCSCSGRCFSWRVAASACRHRNTLASWRCPAEQQRLAGWATLPAISSMEEVSSGTLEVSRLGRNLQASPRQLAIVMLARYSQHGLMKPNYYS